MTREQAQAMVDAGAARWDGDDLVLKGPACDGGPVIENRIRWPGWRRASDGTWIRVTEPGDATA